MTKYMIFSQDEYEPVKKIKHEKEAIAFTKDIANLKKYGCMTVVKETDDGKFQYNEGEWIRI